MLLELNPRSLTVFGQPAGTWWDYNKYETKLYQNIPVRKITKNSWQLTQNLQGSLNRRPENGKTKIEPEGGGVE